MGAAASRLKSEVLWLKPFWKECPQQGELLLLIPDGEWAGCVYAVVKGNACPKNLYLLFISTVLLACFKAERKALKIISGETREVLTSVGGLTLALTLRSECIRS